MVSIRPTPGSVSPGFTVQKPPGPRRTAPLGLTLLTVQPSIELGFVSDAGCWELASRTICGLASRDTGWPERPKWEMSFKFARRAENFLVLATEFCKSGFPTDACFVKDGETNINAATQPNPNVANSTRPIAKSRENFRGAGGRKIRSSGLGRAFNSAVWSWSRRLQCRSGNPGRVSRLATTSNSVPIARSCCKSVN